MHCSSLLTDLGSFKSTKQCLLVKILNLILPADKSCRVPINEVIIIDML